MVDLDFANVGIELGKDFKTKLLTTVFWLPTLMGIRGNALMKHLLARICWHHLRLALLSAAIASVMLSAGDLQAGVMLRPADMQATVGCGASTDESPSKDSDQVPFQSLLDAYAQASPDAGMTGSPTSAGTNGSSVSLSVDFAPAFEFAPPALISAVQGEGRLVFKAPPIFELLRPPRALG